MKPKSTSEGWEEQIKNELIDLVDEYFPKIKPQGENKGRGEAMVLVARALISFDKIMAQEIKKAKREVLQKLLKNGHGGGNFRRLILKELEEKG